MKPTLHSAPRWFGPALSWLLASLCLCGIAIASTALAAERGSPASAASAADPAASNAPNKPALVDINTASEAELRALPDITAARAKAIVSGRPYAKTSELVGQMILPDAVYAKIKNQLTASKPAPKP